MIKNPPPITDLADELFGLVEADQGKAHVSDGPLEFENASGKGGHRRFFAIVRGLLYHQERAARRMRKFLKKYDEL